MAPQGNPHDKLFVKTARKWKFFFGIILFGVITLTLIFVLLNQSHHHYNTAEIRYFRTFLGSSDERKIFSFGHEIVGDDTAVAKCYRCTYDSSGRLTRWQFISRGKLLTDQKFGLAEVRIIYRNDTEDYSFFDAVGRPKLTSSFEGAYGLEIKFDTNPNRAMMRELGCDGKPLYKNPNTFDSSCGSEHLLGQNELDSISFQINEHDNRIPDAKPNKKGWLEKRVFYDSNGNCIMQSNFADNKPRKDTIGWQKLEMEYNKSRDMIEWRTYNASGGVLRTDTMVYDRNGYITLDVVTQYSHHTQTFTRLESKYDERGNQLWWRESSARISGQDTNTHLEGFDTMIYDASNRLVLDSVFGKDGFIVSVFHYIYAESDQPIEQDAINFTHSVGKKTITKFKYDASGDAIETAFYDAAGVKWAGRDHISITRRDFTQQGLLSLESYYDTSGNPVEHGIASKQYSYDSSAMMVREVGYNHTGRIVKR